MMQGIHRFLKTGEIKKNSSLEKSMIFVKKNINKPRILKGGSIE